MSAKALLDSLKGHTILIVGDVMIDRYLEGSVNRISPEAPVPVLLQKSVENRLGGAANVALNLKALGAEPILCSLVGDDEDGAVFQSILPKRNLSSAGIVSSTERRTTVKTRVLSGSHQLIRVDREDTHLLSESEESMLFKRISDLLETSGAKALIFQDYNKGVLTDSLIRKLIEKARTEEVLTTVDPKKDQFLSYVGVDLFKPNLKEIRDSAPFAVEPTPESLQNAAQFLQSRLQNRFTMITLSEKGLYLNEGSSGHIYPTVPRDISDVSGAGDTVIALSTLGLVAGLPLEQIAVMCNLAGGQVCEFPGVVPVQPELLEEELAHWLNAH